MHVLSKIKYISLFVFLSAMITVSAFSTTPEDMNSKGPFSPSLFSFATAEHQTEEPVSAFSTTPEEINSKGPFSLLLFSFATAEDQTEKYEFTEEFESAEEYEFTDEECRQFIKDNPYLGGILLPYTSDDETEAVEVAEAEEESAFEDEIPQLPVGDPPTLKRKRNVTFSAKELTACVDSPTIYTLPKQKPWPAQIIFKSNHTKIEYVVNFTRSSEGEAGNFRLTVKPTKSTPQQERIIPFRLNEDSVLTVSDCLRCLKRGEIFGEIDKRSYSTEFMIMDTTYASLKAMNINDNRLIEYLENNRSRVEFKFTDSKVLHLGYVQQGGGKVVSLFSRDGRIDKGGTKEIEFCRLGCIV